MLRLLSLDDGRDDIGCEAGERDQLAKPSAAPSVLAGYARKRELRIGKDQTPRLVSVGHQGNQFLVPPHWLSPATLRRRHNQPQLVTASDTYSRDFEDEGCGQRIRFGHHAKPRLDCLSIKLHLNPIFVKPDLSDERLEQLRLGLRTAAAQSGGDQVGLS